MSGSKQVNILFGPPNYEKERIVLSFFFNLPGMHVVCGGTTSNVVAKYLDKEIDIELTYVRKDIPPVGRLEGVDLVTEGILTLTRVNEMLESKESPGADGASLICQAMLSANKVTFLCGVLTPEKEKLLDKITSSLRLSEKKTTVIWASSL